ncbi:MAG: GGDEF domain-containing protein [Desulfobulbaceae bacterium]|nr:GGDEF domain-containing protein [Desulfobulbaceae bacterium]HIJ90857.1 GGDEF domain-containing protein [Deltaproteobacteria bacterium]
METFEHPEKSLWIRLWQPFFNMSIYGKFVLVLASFLLGYLLLGLHTYLFLGAVKGQLSRLPVDQELLSLTMKTIDGHIIEGALLVTMIMIVLSITSFLCIRVLVSFLDQMICSLQSLRNVEDASRICEQSSLIPVISKDKIGTVASLVNGVTSDIRKISLFRRTIEADESIEEVYRRLAYVFKEHLGFKNFIIWEVRAKDESIEAVYAWPADMETESCVITSANLCRAKRTGEVVSSSGNPDICPIFPMGDVMTHSCVPMVVSGQVLGVVQFLSLYVNCPEREKALRFNLHRAGQYLKEALPVLHAKHLAGNLQEMATRDALTGLSNRRFLENNINQLIASLKRRNSQMGILMCDLDFFKKVNDEYGHDVGDQILKTLAIILQNTVRSSDIIIRYGGEEFLILLTDCEKTMAGEVAEKIRNAVEKHVFQVENGSLRKTISIGTSLFPNDTEAFWECVKFADIALYKAKETGRNRVVNFDKSLWDSKDY